MERTKMESETAPIASSRNLLGIFLAILISVPIFGYVSVGPAVIRQTDIFLLILGLYVLISRHRLSFPKEGMIFLFPLIGIVIYGSLIMPFQQFPVSNSLVEVIQLIEIIAAFIIIYQIMSDKVVGNILQVIFLISVISSVFAVPYYVFTNSRFVGVWFISGIPSFALFYGLSSYISTRNWISGIGVFLIVIRIVLSRSRSVWLLLPIAGILGLIIANDSPVSKENIKIASGMSLAGLLTTLPIVAVLPSLKRRFMSIISGSQGFFARPVRYFSGIQALENYPLGVGLANYSVALREMEMGGLLTFPKWFRNISGNWIIGRQLEKFAVGKGGPHSDFFKLLVETGLIGVSLFITFWIMVLRTLTTGRKYRYRTAVQTTIIYYGLNSLVNSILLAGGGIILVVFLCIDIYKSKP